MSEVVGTPQHLDIVWWGGQDCQFKPLGPLQRSIYLSSSLRFEKIRQINHEYED